jgi:putative transposase
MARSRYKIFEDQYPYFATGTIIQWLPLFSNPEVVQYILDSWVIMENHLHMVVSSDNLSKELGDFKSYTARQINDYYKKNGSRLILKALADGKKAFKKDREYQFWQEGSHPQQIGSRKMMTQKIEYIHYNPIRRGYIDDPSHWR